MFKTDKKLQPNLTLRAKTGWLNFLMVGTIEPRKGHLQVLKAFDILWSQGIKVNLIVVGNEGWQSLPDCMRRTIPQTMKMLREHPESNRKFYFFEKLSDELLRGVYSQTNCLIAASRDEGFGLPIIEASYFGVPVLAKDIPVFREVAGTAAEYFSGESAIDLAQGVQLWIAKNAAGGTHPLPKIDVLTWDKSAAALLKDVLCSRSTLRN